jgi:hypothetical protein
MNLCVPDSKKSCAACCGLYNVAIGTRQQLERNLAARTSLFASTERTADSLESFQHAVRGAESAQPLDSIIHVCEFAGFLDTEHNLVGCMLHPSAPGNQSVDLRGMCHYGSMACKTFYCPALKELPFRMTKAISSAIEDWHLYGLVATDVHFVRAIFDFLDAVAGTESWDSAVLNTKALSAFRRVLLWKQDWYGAPGSHVRRSAYYRKRDSRIESKSPVERILGSLEFAYRESLDSPAARDCIETGLNDLAAACFL